MIIFKQNLLDDLRRKADTFESSTLLEDESKEILKQMGIRVPNGVIVKTLDEGKQSLHQLGLPVVMKGIADGITHKSDFNLVSVGISDENQFTDSFNRIAEIAQQLSKDSKVLIEEHICGSLEFVVGLTTDRNFGKVLMFGLGGIFVEVLHDVTFKVCPIRRRDARRMIEELRARNIFYGVRGAKSANIEAIEDFLMLIGGPDGIATQYGSVIDTLEINPAMIDGNGDIIAADALIKLAPQAKNEQEEEQVRLVNTSVDLTRLFHPETMGIVGISPEKASFARSFLQASLKLGYKGRVYPINLRHNGKEMMGWRIYDQISSVPEDIDYLYVSVSSSVVPDVLRSGRNKVKFAHIITSGFGETGAEGKDAERNLLATARYNNMRLVGPNSLGMYSPGAGISLIDGLPQEIGSIGIISQSGGLTADILRAGSELGLRFSMAISIGNSVDLGAEDFLECFGHDVKTKIIGIYLEQVKNGSRFFALLRDICKAKPVLLLKGGRSKQGARAASSHTGAMATDLRIWDAMCDQSGVIVVRSIEELLDTLVAFQNLTMVGDNTLLMIGPSGGATVLAADQCDDSGLALVELGPELEKEVMSLGIPPGTSVKNPIDTPAGTLAVGNGKIVRDILEIATSHKHYEVELIHLNIQNVLAYTSSGLEIVNRIVEDAIARGGSNGPRCKRLALVLRGNRESEVEEIIRLQAQKALQAGVPVFYGLQNAVMAIGNLVKYSNWLGCQ